MESEPRLPLAYESKLNRPRKPRERDFQSIPEAVACTFAWGVGILLLIGGLGGPAPGATLAIAGVLLFLVAEVIRLRVTLRFLHSQK